LKLFKILRLKYEDGGHWYSSYKRLIEILIDPYTPESFIIYLDQNGEIGYDLLTYLQGEEVLVKNETIRIPS